MSERLIGSFRKVRWPEAEIVPGVAGAGSAAFDASETVEVARDGWPRREVILRRARTWATSCARRSGSAATPPRTPSACARTSTRTASTARGGGAETTPLAFERGAERPGGELRRERRALERE